MNFDELLSGESQTVEYKKERSASSKSYVKTVVAFANARGGNLVFGVDDKTREVLGIPDERVLEDMDAIANAIMDSVEPQVLPEITVKSAGGKNLILVEVPVGRQCPYYLKSEGVEGGVYVRVGATTRHADLEWVRMLSQECAARLRGEAVPAASDGTDGGPFDVAGQAAKTERTDRKPIETDRKPIETDRGVLVVTYLKEHEDAGISELAEVLGLGKDRAKAVVRDMVSRGLVAKVGDKRYARYVLPEGGN